MSSYIRPINAFRALRKGYSFLGSLQTPKFMFYNRSPSMYSFICKEPIESSCYKYYSTSENPKGGFPNLTDFPINILPNFFNTFKNFYVTNFIIRRYFDEEFSLHEFMKGAKTTENDRIGRNVSIRLRAAVFGSHNLQLGDRVAVEVVSKHLSAGALDELSPLVTPDVYEEIKLNIRKFSLKQKLDLAIDQRDIFACYAHDISVIKTIKEEIPPPWEILFYAPKEKIVEITVTYHVVKGFQRHQSISSPYFNKNLFVLTYRFIRNYDLDKSFWVINGLNHFKPLEEME